MSNDGFNEDLVNGVEDKSEPIKPLFTVEKGEDTSKWVKNAFRILMRRNADYFEEIRENLKLYKGQVFDKQKSSSNSRLTSEAMDPLLEKARNAKLYDNKIFELVEFRVTAHNADKPGVDIGPANVEYEDRIGATLAKAVVDSINYQQDEDEVERNALRYTFLAGEHYVGVMWDPDKGDVNPDWKKAADAAEGDYIEIPNSEDAEKSLKLPKNKPIRNGDVVYKQFPAWKVLPEPVESWDKVNWVITWDLEYIECLKKEYPRKKDLIKGQESSEQVEGFDSGYLNKLREEGRVIVITVHEKRHKYCPEGRLIKSLVNGTVLSDDESPYSDDGLPLQRLTDMDIPGELRGKSGLRNIKGLQYQQFFLTSMAAANLRLMGYPKWVIDQGSINVKDLANTRNVIQKRQGSAAPMILQPTPTSPEVYKQIMDLDTKMDAKVKGAFANPNSLPARIDSALALQYLDEKDLKRNHTMTSKVNAFRVGLTDKVVKRAGQFYKVSDGRLLNIVGKNHEHDLKFFKMQNFDRPYIIRVKSGSALPEQKSAKLEYITTITKEMPGLLTPAQVMDILDLGSVDKLVDITTKALRAAESIIQDLLTGNPVPPPEGFEDLMTYWTTFSTYIQDRQFKESVPAEDKQNVLDYLNGIEALMYDKGLKNPAFGQQLQSLALYPLIFVLPPPMPPEPLPEEATALPPEDLGAGMEMPPEEIPLSPEEEAAMAQQEDADHVNAASDLMRHTVADMAQEE